MNNKYLCVCFMGRLRVTTCESVTVCQTWSNCISKKEPWLHPHQLWKAQQEMCLTTIQTSDLQTCHQIESYIIALWLNVVINLKLNMGFILFSKVRPSNFFPLFMMFVSAAWGASCWQSWGLISRMGGSVSAHRNGMRRRTVLPLVLF